MPILIINSGSSSLKFALLDDGEFLAEGLFERLGRPEARAKWKIRNQPGTAEYANAKHSEALAAMVEVLGRELGHPLPVEAVGHRVVHGGESFRAATLINHEVLARIESCRDLAPLHNPAAALGIRLARREFPDVPHVAVFDTAFHQSLPEHAWMYALPMEIYHRYGVRRYGMHGTSHQYVVAQAANLLERPPEELHLLTAHLGNGCSACAVREGRSVDTTMGLTPLEGLMMGTRSGDVDPNIYPYLRRVSGMPSEEVARMLNNRSGLLGVSGVSNDMRAVLQASAEGYQQATLAVDLFCYRLAKGLLAMAAGLDRIDALVFTGGIGENNALVRQKTLGFLQLLRPDVDPTRNAAHGRASGGRITTDSSPLTVLVVPTSEERAIARQTAAFLPTS
jgi:acetate kinase